MKQFRRSVAGSQATAFEDAQPGMMNSGRDRADQRKVATNGCTDEMTKFNRWYEGQG